MLKKDQNLKHLTTQKWKIPRTVHVTEMGPGASEAGMIWIVLHGYAQNPDELAPLFAEIANNDRVIIPEGMSKFYRKGYEGEVVASWMTSRHRLDEIRDQQDYLNSIYNRIPADSTIKVVVLGFSQGTATALRWMDQNHPMINAMIVYAGWPPEDVEYSKTYWSSIDHYYVLGDNDYFLPPDRIKALRDMNYFKYCRPKEVIYNGSHKVSMQVLKNLRAQLIKTF